MSYKFETSLHEYLPLRDLVFNSIRDAILTGDLTPGERLMEKNLAEKIGVSRTPVREALRKLELEGFVEVIPRKGAMVTVITEKDIKNVLEIRAVLEGLAAKLACIYMSDDEIELLIKIKNEFEQAANAKEIEQMVIKDIELHDLIFKSTKNLKLVFMINNLREQIYRYRLAYLKDKSYRTSILKEHGEIVDAIKNRKQELAEEISIKHIKNQEKAVIKAIRTR